MSSSPDAARKIAERTASLGLADVLFNLPAHATISPRTLARAGAPVDAPRMDALGPTATADLPRIYVDMQLSPEDANTGLPGTADLKALRLIGEGGMGRVLVARQRSLGRDVAIKTLKADESSPILTQGLLREARITGALEHPGIVPVHALGLDDSNMPMLVMKRIEGVSLRMLLDDAAHPMWKTLLSGIDDQLEASVQILMRVCESLSFAHSLGVIHRDIKPDNIMVGAYGEVYLCDWGVAARHDELLAEDQPLVGTPAYMAPEMLLGQMVNTRTDVYLLGATLHHILTGRPRHDGRSMQQILQSVATSDPFAYDAKIPIELGELCNRATAADPELRIASADAFRKELAAHARRRSAMVLCNAALDRMHALESAIEGLDAEKIPEDLAIVYRNATEARFGFVQSLRVEPSLEAAKNGLQRTLVALFDVELRQKHVESAAALLEEMTNPPETLGPRLSAVRKEAEWQRKETERLRAMARDFDPSVEVRPRLIGFGVLLSCSLVIAMMTSRSQDVDELTNASIVKLAVFLTTASIVVFGVLRKRLLTTLFNRRIAGVVVSSTLFLLINRLLGWSAGHSVATIVANDVVILAGMLTIASMTLESRLSAQVGLLVGVRAAMFFFPEHTARLFTAAGVAMGLLFFWIWKVPPRRSVPKT